MKFRIPELGSLHMERTLALKEKQVGLGFLALKYVKSALSRSAGKYKGKTVRGAVLVCCHVQELEDQELGEGSISEVLLTHM